MFMAVDIHSFHGLSISPLHCMEPSLTSLFYDSTLGAKILFHLWSHHDINHILGMNISIFCNSCEVEVDLLGKIFIHKNQCVESAIPIEWQFPMSHVSHNPFLKIVCMTDRSFPSCFHSQFRTLHPAIIQVWINKQID